MSLYPPLPGTTVIAMGGWSRHGKDTAAQIIAELAPAGAVQRFAFSDAIAAYARVQGGMTRREPRLLQELGYAMRQIDASVWLKALYWRIEELRPKIALVTGVRFPDEVEMLRSMGGALVWVERRTATGDRVGVTDRDADFPTETALVRTDFDRLLLNPDGDLGLFRQRVCALYLDLFPSSSLVPWKVNA
jgi:hypothetical protein